MHKCLVGFDLPGSGLADTVFSPLLGASATSQAVVGKLKQSEYIITHKKNWLKTGFIFFPLIYLSLTFQAKRIKNSIVVHFNTEIC